MKIWKRLSLLIPTILLCGCASSPLTNESTLQAGEAFVVMRINSNSNPFQQMIHRVKYGTGTGSFWGTPITTITKPGIQVFKAESVDLYFSNYFNSDGWTKWHDREKSLQFKPTAGKIIYVGDVYVEVYRQQLPEGKSELRVNYTVNDDEAITMEEARKSYPELFAKYKKDKVLAAFPTPD